MANFGVSNQQVGQNQSQQENAQPQYIDVLGRKISTAFVEKYLYQSYPLRVDWSPDGKWEQTFHRCAKDVVGARLSNLQRVVEAEMAMDGSLTIIMVEAGERKVLCELGPVVAAGQRPFPTVAQYEGGRSEERWSGEPDKAPKEALEEWLDKFDAEQKAAAAAQQPAEEPRKTFASQFGNVVMAMYGSAKKV